jgi:NAD(P)-dependent dehydrogenase (short-subunit alcohol dehydrogenase family)
MTWSERDIPPLSGRLAVVTGGNSGLGLEAARMLAHAGAEVILACRDASKAQQAVATIQRETAQAKVTAWPLDLADLTSVRGFAQ